MKCLIFSFLFILQNQVFAENQAKDLSKLAKVAPQKNMVYRTQKGMPSELGFLLISLQNYNLTDEDKKILDIALLELDFNFNFLTKHQLFFIIKTEIYKHLLYLDFNVSINIYDILPKFEKLYLELKQTSVPYIASDPFLTWLKKAVIYDIHQIKNQYNFKQFEDLIALGSKIEKKEHIEIARKIRIFMPLFEFLNSSEKTMIHNRLKIEMFRILENIKIRSSLFQFTQKVKKQTQSNEMTFFTLVEPGAEETNPALGDNKVNKLLEKLVKDNKLEKKTESNGSANDDWRPKEDKLFPKKDPFYQIPETLPESSDDWNSDVSKIEKDLTKEGSKLNEEILLNDEENMEFTE